MPMTSGLNPSATKTAIDEYFFSKFDYGQQPGVATAENALLFKQATTDRSAIITEEFGGPGGFEAHTEAEAPKEATIRSGNQLTFTVANYKKNLPIPREYYADDQHATIQNAVEKMGTRARTTRDKKAFDIYAGGFATHSTGDGAYIWSDSHTTLSGDTVDNLSTGALTPATFETLWRMLVEQASQDGEAGGHTPTAFAVPPILAPDAHEFLKSSLKANTTDNNVNYWSELYPGLQIFTSVFLAAAYHSYANANTAHYLVSDNHGITRWVREGIYTNLISWEYDKDDRWIYKAGLREICGAMSWEGAVASTGA